MPLDVLAIPGSGEWPPLRMAKWVSKKFATLTPIAVAFVVVGEKIHVLLSHALVDLSYFSCQYSEIVICESSPTSLLLPWLGKHRLRSADMCHRGKAT